MLEHIDYQRLDVAAATAKLDDLITCYAEIYDTGNEFDSPERFRQQITGHMKAPRWEAVTANAHNTGELAGYIYGFALPPNTRWWNGLTTDTPLGFTDEDGTRTLAISELMVRARFRRRGIAAKLHQLLLADRPEQRVTLLVEPDADAAQAAYKAWGYEHVAQLRPSWDHAPLFDVLVRPLP